MAVGRAYKTGVGVAADLAEAMVWFLRGAELGQPAAMLEVAGAYMSGAGLPKDPRQGKAWREQASEQRQRMARMR